MTILFQFIQQFLLVLHDLVNFTIYLWTVGIFRREHGGNRKEQNHEAESLYHGQFIGQLRKSFKVLLMNRSPPLYFSATGRKRWRFGRFETSARKSFLARWPYLAFRKQSDVP